MNSFFRELKNRRVYRVALGYAVAAWLVIQIAFTVLPTFHVPEGLLQALVVLAALGFPAALMLAWTFDVTPSGIEKTPEGTGAVGARNLRYAWLRLQLGAIGSGTRGATLRPLLNLLLRQCLLSMRKASPSFHLKILAAIPTTLILQMEYKRRS
jgi:hypothetical protein